MVDLVFPPRGTSLTVMLRLASDVTILYISPHMLNFM